MLAYLATTTLWESYIYPIGPREAYNYQSYHHKVGLDTL
jgi:hypothetical protein